MSARHLNLGRQGEDSAVVYLKKKRYKIVERNWRGKGGELDIICEHKGTIVFVEVKTRTEGPMNAPHHGLTAKKQTNLIRTASQYLSGKSAWDRPCRFDLVAVVVSEDGRANLEHVENVFDAGPGSWQPW